MASVLYMRRSYNITTKAERTQRGKIRLDTANDILMCRLDALNKWLEDVYGDEIDFSMLMIHYGFSAVDIEYVLLERLDDLLHLVMHLLDSYPDLQNGRNQLMIEVYGLLDGDPKDPYSIAHNYGVCGQRIKQLVAQRLKLYHDSHRQQQLYYDLADIVRWLL